MRHVNFTAQEVLATIAGRMTQFRRMVRPQPDDSMFKDYQRPVTIGNVGEPSDGEYPAWEDWQWFYDPLENKVTSIEPELRCPFGAVGERLYVREAWKPGLHDAAGCMRVDYRADCHPAMDVGMKWRSAVHMKQEASRITLENGSMRVERVGNISDNDSVLCGAPLAAGSWPRRDFGTIWDSTHGKKQGCSMADSPWVWVVDFRVVS